MKTITEESILGIEYGLWPEGSNVICPFSPLFVALSLDSFTLNVSFLRLVVPVVLANVVSLKTSPLPLDIDGSLAYVGHGSCI